jgi:hypothetical protein
LAYYFARLDILDREGKTGQDRALAFEAGEVQFLARFGL